MDLVIFILRTYAIWKREMAIGWLFAFSWLASFAGVAYWLEKLFGIGNRVFPPLRMRLILNYGPRLQMKMHPFPVLPSLIPSQPV
jgi:hypothetical protein